MPRTVEAFAPGTVRFLGMARILRIAGPSGTAYSFHRGVTTVVDSADWDWLQSITEDRVQFEILSMPVEPEPVEVVVPDPVVKTTGRTIVAAPVAKAQD